MAPKQAEARAAIDIAGHPSNIRIVIYCDTREINLAQLEVKMSIARKLLIALWMICLIVIIVSVFSTSINYRINKILKHISDYQQRQEEIYLAQDLQLQVANVLQLITVASLTRQNEIIENEAIPAYGKTLSILSKLVEIDKKNKAHSTKLNSMQAAMPAMWQAGIAMYDSYGRGPAEGNNAMAEYVKTCAHAIKEAEDIANKNKEVGKAKMVDVASSLSSIVTDSSSSGVVIASIGFLIFILMYLLRRSIVSQLKAIVEEVNCLATGDLSRQFASTGNDEIAHVRKSLDLHIKELVNVVNQILSTSKQLAVAARQLYSTSEQIADGAKEIVAQSITIATASEEMAATSGDIAHNCQIASEGSLQASEAANKGVQVVERTVTVMSLIANKVQESAKTVENLGARGDQIGAIIGTIEDIADQTNLLALNAAIEAARAGEQGRGFAVVADEVRALAERTTNATKEIGGMIKAIQDDTKSAAAAMVQGVQQVVAGTVEATHSGEALRNILEHVNNVAMQVNQIATAAEEQTATTNEISTNMNIITKVVQNTSGGTQESVTAAAQLNEMAEKLQAVVRTFKL